MATVGSLSVDLTAKIAGFEANMDKANKKLRSSQKKMNSSLSRIQGGFKKLGGAVKSFAGVLAGGLALRAFIQASEAAIAFGDTLAKQADRIGLSVEALQELRFAAERGGVGLEALDKALAKLSIGVGEAQAGTGTLVTLLQKIDPKLLADLEVAPDLEAALDLVFERLKNTESAFERNAIAGAAFGKKAGLAFGTFAGDVDDLRGRLRDMGGVLDEELARKAEVAADELTDLDIVLKTKLRTSVLENIEGFIGFKTLMSEIAIFSVELGAALGTLSTKFDNFLDSLPGTNIRDNANPDALRKRAATLRKIIDDDLRIAGRIDGTLNRATAGRLEKINDRLIENTLNLMRTQRKIEELTGQAAAIGDPPATDPPPTSTGTPSVPNVPGTPSLAPDKVAAIDRITAAQDRLDAANKRLQQSFSFAFENRAIQAITSGKIGDALKGLIKDFGLMILRLAVLQPLAASLFGGLKLPTFNFGGGKAAGGPVDAGRTFIVGERGPELFTPSQSGTIIPNGGGQVVNIGPINNSFPTNLEDVRTQIKRDAPQIVTAIVGAFQFAQNQPEIA